MDQNIKIELGKDGVLTACIDMQGRSMNVFSMDMMDSLERLVVHMEQSPEVRAVVLTSGKSAFIAGADLAMVRMFTERARTDSHSALVELCGRLGRIFRRLEKNPKPWVAAVNGLALGGGLEVCLACHARVVSDGPGVMLGLPEIKLGLLPGAAVGPFRHTLRRRRAGPRRPRRPSAHRRDARPAGRAHRKMPRLHG